MLVPRFATNELKICSIEGYHKTKLFFVFPPSPRCSGRYTIVMKFHNYNFERETPVLENNDRFLYFLLPFSSKDVMFFLKLVKRLRSTRSKNKTPPENVRFLFYYFITATFTGKDGEKIWPNSTGVFTTFPVTPAPPYYAIFVALSNNAKSLGLKSDTISRR